MTKEASEHRIIPSKFRPPWWLRHRHLQTILPSMPWAYTDHPELRRRELELPDGDVTAVDWVSESMGLLPTTPLLVILHGLESSAESAYARMLMRGATRAGWRCCVLHFRDCGDYRNRLPRRYHAGETADIRYFLQTLLKEGNEGPIVAVGYSLGGNVLLKYLGEVGETTPLRAAVAVGVPLDLHLCAEALNTGFSKIYQRYLLKSMKESVSRKFDRHTAAFDWDRTMNARTFAEFDDAVTAPLHGFRGKNDYYDRCSSIRYLKDIETPTLIINAVDDPFMTPAVIPHKDRLSEQVTLEISETGGHVGFVSGGTPWRPEFYLPPRILEFLEPYAASTSFIDSRTRP
ncbi:MAG: hydrolase [Woeseiaceae bacterium]|nr:hydrolase [Woeseiaceae bacterium]